MKIPSIETYKKIKFEEGYNKALEVVYPIVEILDDKECQVSVKQVLIKIKELKKGEKEK